MSNPSSFPNIQALASAAQQVFSSSQLSQLTPNSATNPLLNEAALEQLVNAVVQDLNQVLAVSPQEVPTPDAVPGIPSPTGGIPSSGSIPGVSGLGAAVPIPHPSSSIPSSGLIPIVPSLVPAANPGLPNPSGSIPSSGAIPVVPVPPTGVPNSGSIPGLVNPAGAIPSSGAVPGIPSLSAAAPTSAANPGIPNPSGAVPNSASIPGLPSPSVVAPTSASVPELLNPTGVIPTSLGQGIPASELNVPSSPGPGIPDFTPPVFQPDLKTVPVDSVPHHFDLGSVSPAHLPTSAALPQIPQALTSFETGFAFIDEQQHFAPSAPALNPHYLQAHPGHDFPLTVPQLVGPRVGSSVGFDLHAVRQDFPILQEKVNGRPLIWFDNAATTHKPKAVIDRLTYYYEHENSNVHRAAHELAARSTDAYEKSREQVRRFINASSTNEIVFVRGTTEAINLVAKSWGSQNVHEGDEIILTHLEHHANIVPWQQLCAEKGARLRIVPVDDHGQVRLDEYQKLLSDRTKIVAFTHVSNALGTVTPAAEMIALAHRYGAKVLLDGAQSVSHMAIDVQALDCDWFVFSGHKVFGPTGIGVVYGKEDLLNATLPWQTGGNMIVDVTFEKTVYHQAPGRFEAGTGNIADAVGLGAALEYVQKIGLESICRYEHELLVYGTALLQEIPGLRLIGTAPEKAAVLSFVLEGHSPEAVGSALNQEGIAVRAGHHCAQPILRRFGLEATVRPSLAFYNTHGELEALATALRRIQAGVTAK
ncbi:family 2A encapsulin nanocompartment cargo protein cysteine desulfurase [Synechococcus sp. PCC 6312]|uniref:family 2A encapsulin nanocompartment cargo protein cysteine desulfurase n=1 Tax=Synechococcus sp. (strain ATCC 27167 / PCC 6312) TaxID=195253 RepID=UPI00029F31C8|nr:family 2A encapsulin nanocompartment cargo protein cysteine desulfurase [Synechococcus sp. PCC 6312]AFY61733.1 cysteine desulfurase-like protein, SufS subfamily [Synechococcus sp. PCC 6312]